MCNTGFCEHERIGRGHCTEPDDPPCIGTDTMTLTPVSRRDRHELYIKHDGVVLCRHCGARSESLKSFNDDTPCVYQGWQPHNSVRKREGMNNPQIEKLQAILATLNDDDKAMLADLICETGGGCEILIEIHAAAQNAAEFMVNPAHALLISSCAGYDKLVDRLNFALYT